MEQIITDDEKALYLILVGWTYERLTLKYQDKKLNRSFMAWFPPIESNSRKKFWYVRQVEAAFRSQKRDEHA